MAANSILKLKVDNTEYDANIKKAAEGIQHLAKRMHDAQGDFEGLDKASLDFIKNLQYMTTSAKTASGQYRELENAYKNLAATYEGLNAFEKEGDAGKALAEQLEILKNRTLDMKANMDAASKSLQTNAMEGQEDSSALSKLADKFTVNVDALKLFNWGLQAAEGALQVAKDAFFNNEEQLDEWGRIVESSDSLYKGFLNSLNTGDISGFLQNIGNIVQAARDAYDALDALGTFNAFNQINVEKTRTNMTQSIADFRGGQGSKEMVKAAGEAYKNELKERQRLERDAYLAAVKELAAQRGVSAKDLTDALSGTYGHYQDLKQVMPTGTQTRYVPGVLPGQAGRYEEIKVVQNDQERLGEALRHLNDTELQSLQALGAQAERTGNEIAQVDRQLVRTLNAKVPGTDGGTTGRGGRSGGGSTKTVQTELQQNQAEINRLTQEYVRLGDMSTQSAEERKAVIQDEIEKLKERNGLLGKYAAQAQGRLLLTGSDISMKGLGNFSETMNPFAADNRQMATGGVLKLKLDDKFIEDFNRTMAEAMNNKNDRNVFDDSKKLVSGLNQVAGGLQQMGIKLPTEVQQVIGVINGVMTVIEGVNTVLSVFGSSILTANTIAITANTAALWAVAATNLIPGFAGGGIVPHAASGYMVPGTHFSGDVTPIMANAGELILNRSQQGVLADALQNTGMGPMSFTLKAAGEQLIAVIDRTGKRKGMGELMWWK